MQPRKRLIAVVALLVLGLALVPVFQANILAPADTYYFTNWDKHSQGLVLSKIEQDRVGSTSSRFGLVAATPDPLSPYATFDALHSGARPTASSYSAYASSLGLQGFAFEAAYRAGCTTLNCLNTVESTAFSLVFVLFSTLIALVTRRSLGLVVLFTGLLSPWVVSAAHNLYWVPWTWLLPACAAAGAVLAKRTAWRVTWFIAVGAATALKSSTGYEYLSTTTLLAASVPLLAAVVGGKTLLKPALRSAGIVFVACVAGFVAVLVVHIFVAGDGSFASGAQFVITDALRRTHGSADLDHDPLVNASLHASTASVLARYIIGWSTPLLAIGVGGPYIPVALGPGAFWALGVAAGALVLLQVVRRRPEGPVRAVVYLIGLAPPLSWLVLAKSHSFTETNENYVLWYFIFVPILIWILLDAARTSRVVRRFAELADPPRSAADTARTQQDALR